MIKKKGIQLVTDIMGTKIKTTKAEEVGVVQNVMIDPEYGTIVYIILCYANFIGKTNRHFAVPRPCLEFRRGSNNDFHLEIDEERLLDASGLVNPNTAYKADECVYELFQSASDFTPSLN